MKGSSVAAKKSAPQQKKLVSKLKLKFVNVPHIQIYSEFIHVQIMENLIYIECSLGVSSHFGC